VVTARILKCQHQKIHRLANELLNISDAIKITFAHNALPVAFLRDTHLSYSLTLQPIKLRIAQPLRTTASNRIIHPSALRAIPMHRGDFVLGISHFTLGTPTSKQWVGIGNKLS
jgi:hypothetical protein